MLIVQFNSPQADDAGHRYSPMTRYLLSESTMRRMTERNPNLLARVSNFNAFEKRYCGQPLDGKRLLMYRPRSYGDQLITSALVAYLRRTWPGSIIDYYCDASVAGLWVGNTDPRLQICTGTMTLEQAQRYDYTLCLEGLYENLVEPDQDNCYDVMFRYAGLPDVPAEAKRPHLEFHEKELQRPRDAPDAPYVVVQWEASAIYRSYPPNLLAEVCEKLCESVAVVLVGVSPIPYVFSANCLDLRGKTPQFRSLVPWVSNAACVVAPDSSLGHLAACFPSVPCVSLWGSYDPRVRVSTYSNHIPLVAKEGVCPFAPCYRGLEITPPREFCSQAINDDPQSWVCNQLKAIDPDFIVKTVIEQVWKPA